MYIATQNRTLTGFRCDLTAGGSFQPGGGVRERTDAARTAWPISTGGTPGR